jgi:protein TonB
MSLSAIEQALSGQGAGAGGDFADSFSFASGGRIGGTGQPGTLSEKLESAFNLTEIDQKPRAVMQAPPTYPAEMRGKKMEGIVTVIFVVDPSGRVTNPRVEKANHQAFERPALEAVRQWKFEPAIRGGQRVGCRMRVPIRFQQS